MKKLLIPVLLSSLLLADCTPEQEQKANTLWQESRSMHGAEKLIKIKEALGHCSMKKIELDAYLYLINKNLNSDNLSLETLNSIEDKIIEVRSMNNNLSTSSKVSFQENNTQVLDQLNQKLVNIKVKIETNQEKLSQLKEFQNPSVEQIKGAKRGESIPILIKFSHNNDKITHSQNIKNLAQAIDEMLREDSSSRFTITGYASARGTAKHNQGLSERRATNVVSYIERKYPQTKGHMQSNGKGERVLICNEGFSEDTRGDGEYSCPNGQENESSSRRVEVIKQ
jgi:outer membrane protein OmpA-like peptidoglycan-associated protein